MNWMDEPGSDALEVKIAELLVATADECDHLIDGSVSEVLKLLRERMNMDVVFVSEFVGGDRVFRCVDQEPGQHVIQPGGADPLEESWCQRVVDGRLPEMTRDGPAAVREGRAPQMRFPIGTYLGTSIVLGSGEVYGTLCCFSFGDNPTVTAKDVKKLRYTAELTAQKIDRSRARERANAILTN